MRNVNHLNYADLHNQVYCKRLHKIMAIPQLTCRNCPMFTGFFQGNGIECMWKDIVSQPVKVIPDPKQELLRVSYLRDSYPELL